MKTLFFPCTLDGLSKHSGSAMIRTRWMAKYMDGAAVYDGTQRLSGWDLYVFQKAYLSETSNGLIKTLAALRGGAGGLLAFDLCDPDFLDNEHRERMLRILPLFDFATSPTRPLQDWLSQYLPSYAVHDGVDPDAIAHRHTFDPTDRPSICWFGYGGNTGALRAMYSTIEALDVEVDVIAVDRAVSFEQFLATITRYDICLNPRPAMPPYIYKSPNKTIIALAAGVAVAETGADLVALMDPAGRRGRLSQFDVGAHHIRHSGAQLLEAAFEEALYGSSHN